MDGVIRQDPLGLDRIYVQAKRYGASKAVGRPEIQEFVGALHDAQAGRGVFITTSRFTPEAVTSHRATSGIAMPVRAGDLTPVATASVAFANDALSAGE